jgi:integrase
MKYLGPKRTTKTGLYFYSPVHAGRYRVQQTLKRCGIFLPLVTEYLESFAKFHYLDQGGLRSVQCVLVCLCEFLIEEGITDMEQVSPKIITRFLAWGKDKNRSTHKHIPYVSTFMKWLQIEGRRRAGNPVIPELHSIPGSHREPRPYEEDQMAFFWKVLAERGTAMTRLVMAIGEESGLRLGEITRIHLEDVDTVKQRIRVRLPNKGSRERYAFFHEKTAKYLKEWLAVRDPSCGHDLLLHNTHGGPSKVQSLHDAMCTVLLKQPPRRKDVHEEGMESWSTHRLRHTMASRLTSNGADAATVMAAGGWVTAQAMAGYARVNDTAARRGYDQAMERVLSAKAPALRSLSFSEYIEQFHHTPK